MSEHKGDKDMIKENTKTKTVSNAEVMKAAKIGMKKYRKTLDKLAKN